MDIMHIIFLLTAIAFSYLYSYKCGECGCLRNRIKVLEDSLDKISAAKIIRDQQQNHTITKESQNV